MVNPIPAEYRRVTPYLIMEDCANAVEWYKDVFGATERQRMIAPDGKVGHVEIEIGDSVIMLADWTDMLKVRTPKQLGGCSTFMVVYVEDADAVMAKAVAAGADVRDPMETKFYGDRAGTFVDPWGYVWSPMTHVEDVSPEEMARRAQEVMAAE